MVRELSQEQKVQHINKAAFLHEFKEVVAMTTAACRKVGICCRFLFLPDLSCRATGKSHRPFLNFGIFFCHFEFAPMMQKNA